MDENGNELTSRRPTQALGVEGLEPGHQYSIGLNLGSLAGCYWASVTKNEILVDDMGEGSALVDYPLGKKDSHLVYQVKEAKLNVVE
jgi:hypothetical protein